MRPKIIDVHVHTSTHEMHHMHVTDATLPAIERGMDAFGIERAMVLATYFPFKKRGLHNHDLIERLGDHPRFKAIGSLDAMNAFEEGFEELIVLCREQRLVGIKLYPGYQRFEVSEPKIACVLSLAETHNVPVTIHGGDLHHCCSAKRRAEEDLACGNTFCWIDSLKMLAHPKAFRDAIKAFPNVTFVIAHLANPFFEDLRELMRECSNVMTDTSGQFVTGAAEDTPAYRAHIVQELNRFVEEVPQGAERLLFGSDFPLQSFESTIALVEAMSISEETKAGIYRHNAQRVYHL